MTVLLQLLLARTMRKIFELADLETVEKSRFTDAKTRLNKKGLVWTVYHSAHLRTRATFCQILGVQR